MEKIYINLENKLIEGVVKYYNDHKNEINNKEVVRKYRDFFNVFNKYYRFSKNYGSAKIEYHTILSLLKWFENMSVYDKLGKYGDFYYKIKNLYRNTKFNSDRVNISMSYFDYKLVQEGLKLLLDEKLKHTKWVGKPRYEEYGAPLDYWYEGNKETHQIESTINYLKNQID